MAFIVFLFTLLFLSFTVYLLYVRFNKAKLKSIKKKHPLGSPNHEAYRVLYSTKTLLNTASVSAIFLIILIGNTYKSTHPDTSDLVSLLIFGSIVLIFGLHFYGLRRIKNK